MHVVVLGCSLARALQVVDNNQRWRSIRFCKVESRLHTNHVLENSRIKVIKSYEHVRTPDVDDLICFKF